MMLLGPSLWLPVLSGEGLTCEIREHLTSCALLTSGPFPNSEEDVVIEAQGSADTSDANASARRSSLTVRSSHRSRLKPVSTLGVLR